MHVVPNRIRAQRHAIANLFGRVAACYLDGDFRDVTLEEEILIAGILRPEANVQIVGADGQGFRGSGLVID